MTRYGALPPEGFEWQIGKTVASVQLVNSAERYLETCSNSEEIRKLTKIVQEIKEGKRSLTEFISIEECLQHESTP